jgi:hypothetical protein
MRRIAGSERRDRGLRHAIAALRAPRRQWPKGLPHR